MRGGRLRRVLRVALATIFGASALAAQQLRGTVLLPDSATRAPGVIVELLSPSGALVERTLTNPRGDFVITAPNAGSYTARALRVGFRPTQRPGIVIGTGETAPITIVLSAFPVSLDAITVLAADQCRLRPDSGQMVYKVWAEASKALVSSRLAALVSPLTGEWITYRRLTDPSERRIVEQTIRTTRGSTTTVFKSWDAESLAVEGYVVERAESTTFHAPDAQVLLSDAFAAGHCLRLQRPSADSSHLIGVHFEPVRKREAVSDITGTFWVDRATAELRSLDFSYTGLPRVTNDARPGGHVEFTHLPTGNWIINRWFLRLPELGTEIQTRDAGRMRFNATSAILRGIRIAGGEVMSITRDGARLFTGELPAVRVAVTSRDPAHPASSATVLLDGTDYEARVDSTGEVLFAQVLPGTYRALVRSTLTELALVPPAAKDIVVRAPARSAPTAAPAQPTRVDSIALPATADVLRAACNNDAPSKGESMLVGFVRDSLGRGRADVVVSASWLADVRGLGSAAASSTLDGVATRTGDAGQYRLCDVPRDARITVRSESDSGRAATSFNLANGEHTRVVDLDYGAAQTGSPDSLPALLELIVTAPGGAPVGEVVLDVSIGSFNKRVRTSEKGLALVANVPPGVVGIRTRRVGFQTGDLAVIARPGRNTVPIHLDVNKAPVLDTVRIMGSRRVSSRLDEFEMRRRMRTATATITRDDILKRNPVDTWQMLLNVPSVKVITTGNVMVAQSARGNRPSAMEPLRPCNMRLMVNGLLIPAEVTAAGELTDLSYLPPPAEVHGIEVFAGAASIPPQYGGSGGDKWCGLIVVWTR